MFPKKKKKQEVRVCLIDTGKVCTLKGDKHTHCTCSVSTAGQYGGTAPAPEDTAYLDFCNYLRSDGARIINY